MLLVARGLYVGGGDDLFGGGDAVGVEARGGSRCEPGFFQGSVLAIVFNSGMWRQKLEQM